jgi:hypothetical protein
VPRGLDQLDLGLLPPAGGGEDAAVVGPAERGDHVATHAHGRRPHPLVGPWDVEDQFAGPEQPAEDLVDRGDLGELAGAERGQRLVSEDQSLLDAIGEHVHAAQVGHRHEFDVRVSVPPADRDRLAQQRLAHGRIPFDECADDEHPAVLGPVRAGLLEQRAGPGEPPAAHRPFAEDVTGDPGQHPGRPAGRGRVALPTVRRIGALVVVDGRHKLAGEVQRLTQALQGLTGGVLGDGAFEQAPAGGEVTVAQGGQAVGHERCGHHPMMARLNARRGRRPR